MTQAIKKLLQPKKLLLIAAPLALAAAAVFLLDARLVLAPMDPKAQGEPPRRPDVGLLPPLGKRLGTALLIKDTVSFKHGETWKKLTQAVGIAPEDLFTTHLAGEVAMVFYNGQRAVLGQEGVVKVGGGKDPAWGLQQGRLMIAASPTQPMVVQTPHALVTLEPGGVAIVFSDEKKSVVSLALGMAQVEDPLKAFDPQKVTGGLKTVVLRGGGPAPSIADDHQADVAYLAQQHDTIAAADKSLHKWATRLLGKKTAPFASLLPLAAISRAGEAKAAARAAAKTPPAKPATPTKPQAIPLATLEEKALTQLYALRQATAVYALGQGGARPPANPEKALALQLGGPLPSLALGGNLTLKGVTAACPPKCPNSSAKTAWLYCAEGSVARWRINDLDGQGRDLCQE